MTITCIECKKKLNLKKFYKRLSDNKLRLRKDARHNINRKCITCKSKINKLRALEHKIETFNAYGGCKCACKGCDIVEPKFLTLDHIGNSKIELGHGTSKETRGRKLYKTLRLNGYPYKNKLRVLCYNCNCTIGCYGSCPHNA